MRPRLTLGFCVIVLAVGLASSSVAAIKYSQPPKTGLSYDFASEVTGNYAVGMADDWVCSDGIPIMGIRWWGSYWLAPAPGLCAPYSDGLKGASPGMVTHFVIGVFQNLAADAVVPFDRPNFLAPLAAWQVPIAQANETYAFTVQKFISPPVTEDVYSYYADLTQAQLIYGNQGPFSQQAGTKYWLCILAHHQDANRQWGWHEASGGPYGSYAVQGYITSPTSQPGWYIPCGGHDMAFELIPVPEPGSLCVLAAGLLGTVGFVGVRRRRS
ncbi:MAG: PEP-CTERM sorting domain-containing protein [Armatimonadetes bacterium]|nr:PEP-CTERM sorting domain-containing protein [Armatimonadota bacterium]